MGRLQTLAAQAMLVRRGESTRSSGLWALEVEEVELGAEEAQISGGGGGVRWQEPGVREHGALV